MKIGLIAAYGRAGSHILREARMREHDVTAIVINKANLRMRNVKTMEKDLFHLTKEDIEPFDVLINAFAPSTGEAYLHVKAGKHLICLNTKNSFAQNVTPQIDPLICGKTPVNRP